MSARILERGNIILLKKGMQVNIKLEERFVESNKPFSSKIVEHSVQIGEILRVQEMTESDKCYFRNDLEGVLYKVGINSTEEELKKIVTQILSKYEANINDTFNTNGLAGEYVVIHTGIDNEGGPKKECNVVAKKLCKGVYDPNGVEVTFYQIPGHMSSICPSEIEVVGDLFKFN